MEIFTSTEGPPHWGRADGQGGRHVFSDADSTQSMAGKSWNTISGSGATQTLTAAQSCSTILFDRAAGITYTLPVPTVGLWYRFAITTSITSNNAKVVTNAGTVYMVGQVLNAVSAGTGTTFIADGTSHVAITQNGTTSGGLKGSLFEVYCVTSTLWLVRGVVLGSGTIVTPFATS